MNDRALRAWAALRAWTPVEVRWLPLGAQPHLIVCWPQPAADDPRRTMALELIDALRHEAATRGIELLGATVECDGTPPWQLQRALTLQVHVASPAAAAHIELLCDAATRRAAALARHIDEGRVRLQMRHVDDESVLRLPPAM